MHNCLKGIGVRDKIKLIASGKTASGFDIISKIAVGADVVNAARTMMMALGCIQSQSCNTNRCPTGIATQDPVRGKALDIDSRHQRVANFQRNTLNSFFDIVGAMGLDDPDKLAPRHIWRRVEDESKRYFDEIYPSLAEYELLGDKIEGVYNVEWAMASADTFVSQPTDGSRAIHRPDI